MVDTLRGYRVNLKIFEISHCIVWISFERYALLVYPFLPLKDHKILCEYLNKTKLLLSN